jgi:putative membrane protein
LSSTSSAEQPHQKLSATEILASRYRHLFILPSTGLLALYGAAASLLLVLLSKGTQDLFSFIPAFATFILSSLAVSSALLMADRKTIANFRRLQAVLLSGAILWVVCMACGAAYAWLANSTYALTNATLFGALAATGFEFLIINGAFSRSVPLSACLAALYPLSTLLIIRLPELSSHFDLVAASSGVLAAAVIGAFTVLLKRRKTSMGHDAMTLFRAFLKTWVASDPKELEGIISDHSVAGSATTKVLRFTAQAGDIFIVLPGVHPGPFHPVGSYDLPGMITRAFKGLGPVMTLHRPGGHERNLATSADTLNFAESLRDFSSKIGAKEDIAIRGPIHAQVGKAQVSASALSGDLLMTISFAPYGSDDLSIEVEASLGAMAASSGLDASIVDAHNSIDHDQESPDLADPGWKRLLDQTSGAQAKRFRVAYSHSNDIGFAGRGDLTENGIGLLMLESGGTKSVLVLADANNSVPGVRAKVAKELDGSGYSLIEFCTSDSHNLAARGLTVERGYRALGEETPIDAIAKLVVEMAKVAEARLSSASYGSGVLESQVKVFGSGSLEEFAKLTQSSSKFSGGYFKFAGVSVVLLLVLALAL